MKKLTAAQTDILIKAALAGSLILFAVAARVAPHPANFAPIAAIALFGGAILPRKWALSLPLMAMVISDLIIGLHPLLLFTWGSFALVALMAGKWLKKISVLSVGAASLGASLLFFIVSNLGVWLEGRLYSLTFEGLISCYYNALPFFRGTLLGDLAYSALLFGAYAFVYRVVFGRRGQLALQRSDIPKQFE
jgi:hypothetical protein